MYLKEEAGEMEDRRVFARIKVKLSLKFVDTLTGKTGQAETVDISANGVGFITDETLSPKTPLELWLDIPDKHEPVHMEGKVIWSKSNNGISRQRVGVCLENPEFIELARVMRIRDNA